MSGVALNIGSLSRYGGRINSLSRPLVSTWTPLQIPTALWLDAADSSTITLNGSTVSQWSDKSGNGRNAVQATAANQPAWGVGRNLLLWSEQFDNAFWAKAGAIVTQNAGIAPNGTTTADKLISTTGVTAHVIFNSPQVETTAGISTWTIRAKAAEYNFITIAAIYSGRYSVTFNLTTGAVTKTATSGTVSSTSNSALSLGNGWWELSISMTAGTGAFSSMVLGVSNTGTPTQDANLNVTEPGDGVSGCLIWGAQINPGTTADPYQQTTSAGQALTTGLNGKATLAWPDALNNRFLATSTSFAVQDVFIVARYRDGTQTSWFGAYQGVFGGGVIGSYIGLIGDTPDKWYIFCDFNQLRKNGGSAQALNTNVTALPLPASLLNSTSTSGARTAGFCVGNDRDLALNRGWSGVIAEVVALSATASTEIRQRIEGYLAWKWGLQSSLPSDHPYKLLPPTV